MPATKKTEKINKEHEGGWVVNPEFVITSKGIFPLAVLKAAEIKEDKVKSKQLKEESQYLQQHGLVPLPFNADSLLTLKDNCSYFDACVKQIAKDVIGQGWTLELREGVEKENKVEKKRILNFIANSGGDRDETFEQTLERGIIDWGCIGWWGWEVGRKEKGKDKGMVSGMWHVPAQTIRVHKSHDKYAQIRGDKKEWFKRFGTTEDISGKTGKDLKLESVKEDEDKKKLEKERAHEMIFYRNYYPQSDYYGAPNILSSVGAVTGLIGVRDYNLSFFENYGIPAGLLILKGKWDKSSAKKICDFLDVEIKGTDNAHKTMAIHIPTGGEFEWKQLSAVTKEGSFELYRKDLRDEVLVAYKMPPYRIGISETGSLGGSTASESTRIYVASVVTPLEKDVERLVTQNLIVEGLQCKDYTFNLNELDIRDKDAEAKRDQLYFGMGTLTPNQILKRQGRDNETYSPEGDQYYVSSTYIPVGEEAVEKREANILSTLEELKTKVNEALDKK